MLVVVIAMLGVAVAGVHEIDVITVLNGFVTTFRAMRMVVRRSDYMHLVQRALVIVILMGAVRVPIVEVVHMPVVFDGRMPAIGGMVMIVHLVHRMLGGHLELLPSRRQTTNVARTAQHRRYGQAQWVSRAPQPAAGVQ